jgi:hypothetical protein
MEHAVKQIVAECAERAMDVRLLAAAVAVAADQRGAAIEAGGLVRVAVGPRLAGRRLD